MGRIVFMVVMLAGVILPFMAGATEWTFFFDDGDVRYYIDAASRQGLSTGKVRAWQKAEIIRGREVLSLVEMDCAGKMVAVVQVNDEPPTPDNELSRRHVEPTDFESARYTTWCGKGLEPGPGR